MWLSVSNVDCGRQKARVSEVLGFALKAASVAVLTVSIAGCVTQQTPVKPVPKEWVDRIYSACLKEDISNELKMAFCRCTADKVGAKFGRDELAILGLDMSEAEDDLAEFQTGWGNKKIRTIVLECIDEVGRTSS